MREDVDDGVVTLTYQGEFEKDCHQSSLAGDFRDSMRNLAASVSVVTIGTGGEASGFTATSVVSLSVDTPTVLVSLNRSSASWAIVRRSRRFAINILSANHRDIADTFAGRRGLHGRDRYIDPRWLEATGRIPRLADALSVIECELEEAIERYSHAILIGRVTNVATNNALNPLVYWQGKYNQICTEGFPDK